MSTEQNKAIVRCYFEEVYNQHDDTLIHELFAPGFRDLSEPDHHGLHGPALAQHVVDYERSVFPDIHFTVEDMLAEGDDVVVRLTIRGTHRGTFRGIPPTGRRVTVTGIERLRLTDGKIAQVVWHYYDRLAMLQQMDAIPPARIS